MNASPENDVENPLAFTRFSWGCVGLTNQGSEHTFCVWSVDGDMMYELSMLPDLADD